MVKITPLFFSNSVMITHFGRNPVNGGSPPKDKSVVGRISNIVGILFHMRDERLIDVIESIMNKINIEEVRKM